MVKKIVVVAFTLILLSSFVVAQEYSASKIVVKSVPDVTVYLKIVEASSTGDGQLYKMILERTDEYGDAYFMYSTNDTDKMKFDLEVKVKDGKVQVYPSSGESLYGSYETGEDVYIEAYEDYHNIIETPGHDVASEDINNTQEVEIIDSNDTMNSETIDNDANISANLITGNSILDTLKKPVAYGGIGGFFILGILGIFIFGRKKKFKEKSSTDSTGAKHDNHLTHANEGSHNELSKAEAKLKSIQAEIQSLKNGSKVSEVKKRIAAEEEELRKLRSERV